MRKQLADIVKDQDLSRSTFSDAADPFVGRADGCRPGRSLRLRLRRRSSAARLEPCQEASADLRAVEYGDKVLIDFTIPDLTTDDLPLRKVSEVELRVGRGTAPFDTGQWAAAARKVPVTATGPGAVQAMVPAREWIDQEIVIGVRVVNTKGRASDWSNLATVRVITPVAPPASVAAAPDPGGVRLSWSSSSSKFRVYRRTPGGEAALLDSPEAATFVDKTAEYGKPYEYLVQALTNGAESEVSQPAAITPRDIFPPRHLWESAEFRLRGR